MSKLVQMLVVTTAALAMLTYAGPTLTTVIGALVPLVLVVGVVVAVLQLVVYLTRR